MTEQPNYSAVPPQPRHPDYWKPPTKEFAVASFVLGIVGLLLSWVPFFGLVLVVLALIFGILALVRHYPGKGLAIAGVATGAVGLLIASIVTVAIFTVADEVSECVNLLDDWADTPGGSDAERRAEQRYEDAGCGNL